MQVTKMAELGEAMDNMSSQSPPSQTDNHGNNVDVNVNIQTPVVATEVKLANAQCKLKDGRIIPIVIDASKVDWMLSNENDICRQVEKVVGPNNIPTKPILLKVSALDSAPRDRPTAIKIPEDRIERHMWDDDETARLLATIKQWWKPLKAARNKRLIWARIAEQVGDDLNADKVIDKWKMLKKKYRKMFPEPFLFSDTLRELLGEIDMNSSDFLNVECDSINTAQDSDLMDALLEQPPPKKRRGVSVAHVSTSTPIQPSTPPTPIRDIVAEETAAAADQEIRYQLFYEMKRMLEERDDKMMKMFREFQEDNNRLLEQLIASLPSPQ